MTKDKNGNIIIEIPTLKESDTKFLEKYDKFIKSNKISINNSNKTELLLKHIDHNLDNLSDRVRILRLKYADYKWWYDNNNISIIVISALLTLISAIASQLQTEIDKIAGLQYAISIIPIVFGAIITLIAAIMKFYKLQANMEKISNLIERSIIIMSKLKKTSEDLYFKKNNDVEFKQLEVSFLNETCDMCNNCIMQMEQLIRDEDYEKYLQKIKKSDKDISQIIVDRLENEIVEAKKLKQSNLTLDNIKNAKNLKDFNKAAGEDDLRRNDNRTRTDVEFLVKNKDKYCWWVTLCCRNRELTRKRQIYELIHEINRINCNKTLDEWEKIPKNALIIKHSDTLVAAIFERRIKNDQTEGLRNEISKIHCTKTLDEWTKFPRNITIIEKSDTLRTDIKKRHLIINLTDELLNEINRIHCSKTLDEWGKFPRNITIIKKSDTLTNAISKRHTSLKEEEAKRVEAERVAKAEATAKAKAKAKAEAEATAKTEKVKGKEEVKINKEDKIES